MPAAIAGVAIAGQIYGAKKASDASKSAAKIQVQATDKAQAFNEQAYKDQQTALQPYMQGGQEAFARLMANHWGTPLPQGMSPSGGTSAMLGNAARGFIPQQGPYSPPQGGPPQGPPPQGPPPQMVTGTEGSPQGSGQMVQMKAPNGQVSSVPEEMVEQFMQKGAVRV